VIKPTTPEAWANRVTKVLDVVLQGERFPVKVADVAIELSRQFFPDERIAHVRGENLPGFEGALLRVPGTSAWAILYNDSASSRGRINFTLAHELAHYFVHRERFPEGIRCSPDAVVRSEAANQHVEAEANTFASYLLMPFNDYRRQLGPDDPPTWEALSACAERYGVSLVAATLRWLKYTSKRAVLVLSRDGFVLWSRSSGDYRPLGFIGSRRGPVEVPTASPAARNDLKPGQHPMVEHAAGVWCAATAREMAIRSDSYDFTMSLLVLGPDPDDYPYELDDEEDDGMVSTSEFMRTPFAKPP